MLSKWEVDISNSLAKLVNKKEGIVIELKDGDIYSIINSLSCIIKRKPKLLTNNIGEVVVATPILFGLERKKDGDNTSN